MRFYLPFYILLFTFYVLISPASAQVRFTNVTEAVGLGDLIIPALATWGDYDNDGNLDLVPTSGSLYRNEGNGRFANVTEAVGMDVAIGARASAFGDFDNDGNLDLFISSGVALFGNVLYRNRGDGTFLNVSRVADMKSKVESYFGALSFDYNNDGLLDIFIGNWSDSTPYPNLLYRNEGGFRFKEIAAQVGLDKPEFSMGLALGDYDNDGDLDVFLGVSGPTGEAQGIDVLYRNEGGDKFIDVAQQAGVQRKANHLSAFFWDYDNDGDLDLFVQAWHYRDEDGFSILYRNNGNGAFTEVTQQAGIEPVKAHSSGAYYGDYDNDGWLDLCITYHNLPTLLYHNNGNGTFTEVSKEAEISGNNSGTTSLVDYDNDGDLDILTGAWNGKLRLYRNDGAPNHWLKLKLIGSKSNRDAIGARIKVIAGRLSMLREIAGSAGIGSHQDRLPVHLGLGKNREADIIEIRWPSGIIQTFTNISADQQLTIDEFEGILVVVQNTFPAFGDPKGGTPVQIHGEHFAPGSKVFFGGIEASDVKVESPSLITAITTPGTTGWVDVEVVRPDGKRGILRNGFRYTNLKMTKITPESGPITGGITVQIEGVGFQRGAEVQIGNNHLTNVFVTSVLIRGILPPGMSGVVDVSVTNLSGEKDVLKGAFTYVPPPKFRDFSPISPIFTPLTGFGEITIKGSGFIPTPNVQIGGVATNVDFISSNELRILPRQFLAVGPQDVVVINPDGQRAVLPQGVTVLAPIKIKSVEPNSGGLEGGTKITIVGEPIVEFAGRNYPSQFVIAKVFIGNVQSEAEVLSDNIITAITPPNTPGPKDVRVVNVDDQSDTLKNAFIYNPLPQITKVIPNNGPLAGGTKIRIQGSKFLPGAEVLIGDIDLGSYSVASAPQVEADTFITAITPIVRGEPGSKDVVIINPDGQRAELRDGFIYNPLPTIRNISPSYGSSSGGTKLIIRGTGFLQGARVIIGKNFATTEFKDDATIEAVTPANPKGKLDVKVINPDTQEAVIERAFISVGELAYNYPNPFQASRGTTFRYVPGPNESVESIVVKIFNLAGVPIGVVGQEGSNEVRWQDSKVNVGLYVYLMEVKVGGQVKRFKRALEVYK